MLIKHLQSVFIRSVIAYFLWTLYIWNSVWQYLFSWNSIFLSSFFDVSWYVKYTYNKYLKRKKLPYLYKRWTSLRSVVDMQPTFQTFIFWEVAFWCFFYLKELKGCYIFLCSEFRIWRGGENILTQLGWMSSEHIGNEETTHLEIETFEYPYL